MLKLEPEERLEEVESFLNRDRGALKNFVVVEVFDGREDMVLEGRGDVCRVVVEVDLVMLDSSTIAHEDNFEVISHTSVSKTCKKIGRDRLRVECRSRTEMKNECSNVRR